MSSTKYLDFRGDLRALSGDGSTLVFAGVHPDGLATELYRFECETQKLDSVALPCGAVAVIGPSTASELMSDLSWVLGTDQKLYSVDQKAAEWGIVLEQPPTSFCRLSNKRLGIIAGEQLVIVDASKKKKTLQTLALADSGTALAASPDGTWIAVGTKVGQVCIFQAEEQDEFVAAEADKLHDGAVTSLLFEPEELRFLSAGVDQKLLLTHARGKLEPEDRGRGGGHSDRVTAMVHVPGERFITGSADKSLKTWTRSGGTRPATQSDGVLEVVDLALVSIHKRPHVAVVCSDNSLRLWLLDASGKFGQQTHTFRDAYANAKHELAENDVARRQAALHQLAKFNDNTSLTLITKQINEDADHGQRLLAAVLLGDADHPAAASLLEAQLDSGESPIRVAAFEGLQKRLGKEDLRPVDLALKAKQKDVGQLAVSVLEKLSANNDQALERLVQALDQGPFEVRFSAMTALESIGAKDDASANLKALDSKHRDLREAALVRLLQRKLLSDSNVQGALRRHLEDKDASVRRTAFQVSILKRSELATALRARDKDLHRQLFELENTSFEEESKDAKKKKELPKTRKSKLSLEPADYDPLLQAMATRAVDVCLIGTRCLAMLEDSRAFGMLLQLSREPEADARVDVCRAFGSLKDPRSASRLRSLMLDDIVQVRDAAFSAMAEVYSETPFIAAQSGLAVGFEDVQKRALQLLSKKLKASPPKKTDDEGSQLMLQALNSSFPAVRLEAFKTIFNTNIGGGGADTLKFVLSSGHADVRLEVLTEVMSRPREDWAWTMLQELFADPDSSIRTEAFEFAVKHTRGRDLTPVEAATMSPYPDTRQLAIAQLMKKPSAETQPLLVGLLGDDNKDVRMQALTGLISVNDDDAMKQALMCQHKDVRVAAAAVWATSGNKDVLPVLTEIIQEEEPTTTPAEIAAWKKLVIVAMSGLAKMGDSNTFESVAGLLKSPHAQIRAAAAEAMIQTSSEESLPQLKEALRHEDDAVKNSAAFALAILGDGTAASRVFGKATADDRKLAAAVSLAAIGEVQLPGLLDSAERSTSTATLIYLLSRDLVNHSGLPDSAIGCLSAENPRVRLKAAEAIQNFHSKDELQSLIASLFNDRGDESAWEIAEEAVSQVCLLLNFGSAHVKARTVSLLWLLKPDDTAAKQDEWDLAWNVHSGRFSAEIKILVADHKKRKLAKSELAESEARQLAFGTFVGVLREPLKGASGIALRLTSMDRLQQLMDADSSFVSIAQPILIQALGYKNREVRSAAFGKLKAIGMDAALLAAEAIESGYDDLGIAGLNLLMEGATAAKAKKVLEQCMLTRTDEIAIKAAALLIDRTDVVSVAKKAADATGKNVRLKSVGWLADHYDTDDKVKKQLRDSLKSRHEEVRWAAAQRLAAKNDSAAVEPLIERLQQSQGKQQLKTIEVLRQIGDAKVPAAMIQRVLDDPTGTAETKALLDAAGKYRQVDSAEAFLEMMDHSKLAGHAFQACLVVSGFDQRIHDPEDKNPDRRWLEKQHPRHTDVLAQLMTRCMESGDPQKLVRLIPAARWAMGSEVDSVLQTISVHPADDLRHSATEAIAWRLRKRDGSAEPLIKSLEHKNPITKFIAAEGLANAERSEGIRILLSSIDLMDDLQLRQRGVRAIGKLADIRTVDVLLKLATDDGHALQEEAIEAIGHLKKSDQADEILELLKRFAKGVASLTAAPGLDFNQEGMRVKAIRGLRWFDSHDSWNLIRELAAETTDGYHTPEWKVTAIEMLADDDNPATADLLIQCIEKPSTHDCQKAAVKSARKVLGEESLEPDYAYLKSENCHFGCMLYLERVKEAPANRLFEVLSVCPDSEVVDQIASLLLRRDKLPAKEAANFVSENEVRCVSVAAQIIGRDPSGTKDSAAIVSAIAKWSQEWHTLRHTLDEYEVEWDDGFIAVTDCLKTLIWAASRLGCGESKLIELTTANPGDALFRPVRVAVVEALAELKSSKAITDAFEELTSDENGRIRQIATTALAIAKPKQAEKLADQLLSDRLAFGRLIAADANITKAVLGSATNANCQGIVLPHIVSASEHKTLVDVAKDSDVPEPSRLGAIEGLARIGNDAAEKALVTLGKSKDLAEELRRAAWAGLRRSKRMRQKAAMKEGSAT